MGIRRPGAPAEPPGWDGEQRGEPGIHGVARPRRWDAVVVAEAPGLVGETHSFAVLAQGPVVDGASAPQLLPLARAIAAALEPPFAAEAIAHGRGRWAVAGRRIRVERLPDARGSELELVRRAGVDMVRVDGWASVDVPPTVSELAGGSDCVVRVRRLLGDVWEVDVTPL